FILRGVTLVGIDSVMAPMPLRTEAWDRLARDLDLGKLAAMSQTRPAEDVVALAPEILAGQVRGRIVLQMEQPPRIRSPAVGQGRVPAHASARPTGVHLAGGGGRCSPSCRAPSQPTPARITLGRLPATAPRRARLTQRGVRRHVPVATLAM